MSSDTPISPSAPTPNAPSGGDTSAAGYIAKEVQQARVGLQRTRIIGLIALLLLGGEMIYITTRFTSSLEAHSAAEIADGMIMQQINDRGPELAGQLKQKIPEYIQQTPDYALKELPNYRKTLEDRLVAQLKQYCDKTNDKLNAQLDTYLADHKEDIKGMIATGNDPVLTKKVGLDLKKQLLTYVQEKPQGGDSIQNELDISLAALQGTATTMHHLAVSKSLTPQEKQTRHALAVLTSSISIH